ncbi:hypothetical protein QQP08_003344, partial [Theobroma cacao]
FLSLIGWHTETGNLGSVIGDILALEIKKWSNSFSTLPAGFQVNEGATVFSNSCFHSWLSLPCKGNNMHSTDKRRGPPALSFLRPWVWDQGIVGYFYTQYFSSSFTPFIGDCSLQYSHKI